MVYDFAIVGAGAAGLQLALAMANDPYFDKKTILIVEPQAKNKNDRTWCFWEKGKGKYDSIITKQWNQTLFYGNDQSISFDIHPYSYKMLRSIDFYRHVSFLLKSHKNIHWVQDSVTDIDESKVVGIKSSAKYYARHVFDSRLPVGSSKLKEFPGVLQHFIGWEIEVSKDIFDVSSFTMMDYRLKWPATTSFTYVLPYAPNKALVEFTFFSPDLVENAIYEKMLKTYIGEQLGIDEYTITAVEKGVIPMSGYPFHKHNTEKVTKIGTAGGWVKPSSGYSFKNSGNKCQQIIENIKRDRHPQYGLVKKKYRLYDRTFLAVLQHENYLGEALFTTMYSKNDISDVLAFLDEETTFFQELALMNTFPKRKFMAAMFSALLK